LTQILLVDDEQLITDSLSYSLKREGFEVDIAADGLSAIKAVEETLPDLIVLDLMLPDISGFEVCRRLRTFTTTPVIMLTARGEEIDRVLGLEVGADDYLAKPFSFRELLARIQAMLRRVQLDRQVPQSQHVAMGQLSMDPVARRVYKGDQEVQLSAREFDLLAILMKNAGRAMNRDELIKLVWGDDWVGDPRTLDVHVRWLRLKIEEDPASPQFIQTVRGYGYRFAGQRSWHSPMKFARSLNSRLVLSHLAVSLVSIALMAGFAGRFIFQAAIGETEHNLQGLAFAAGNALELPLQELSEGTIDKQYIQDMMSRMFADTPEMQFTVYQPDGFPLVDSSNSLPRARTGLTRQK